MTSVLRQELLGRPVRVHLKVDTGMHRVGAHPEDVVALATLIDAEPTLEPAADSPFPCVNQAPGFGSCASKVELTRTRREHIMNL